MTHASAQTRAIGVTSSLVRQLRRRPRLTNARAASPILRENRPQSLFAPSSYLEHDIRMSPLRLETSRRSSADARHARGAIARPHADRHRRIVHRQTNGGTRGGQVTWQERCLGCHQRPIRSRRHHGDRRRTAATRARGSACSRGSKSCSWCRSVPQQLQQVQALQQHQLLYVQQLLQIVPAQLQQLQQLVQGLSQQVQPLQAFGPTLSGPLGFGLAPQAFGGQAPSHVM